MYFWDVKLTPNYTERLRVLSHLQLRRVVKGKHRKICNGCTHYDAVLVPEPTWRRMWRKKAWSATDAGGSNFFYTGINSRLSRNTVFFINVDFGALGPVLFYCPVEVLIT